MYTDHEEALLSALAQTSAKGALAGEDAVLKPETAVTPDQTTFMRTQPDLHKSKRAGEALTQAMMVTG